MKSESGWGGATAAVSPLRSRNCVETESFDSFLSSTGSDGRREEGGGEGQGEGEGDLATIVFKSGAFWNIMKHFGAF